MTITNAIEVVVNATQITFNRNQFNKMTGQMGLEFTKTRKNVYKDAFDKLSKEFGVQFGDETETE